jgi:hypothetical protein
MIVQLFCVLVAHWIFDYVLQSHSMAVNKSRSALWLTLHASVYSLWTLPVFGFPTGFWLWIFATHWYTDYLTSRVTSKLWAAERYHYFFVVLGLDQLLHYAAIFGGLYITGWL